MNFDVCYFRYTTHFFYRLRTFSLAFIKAHHDSPDVMELIDFIYLDVPKGSTKGRPLGTIQDFTRIKLQNFGVCINQIAKYFTNYPKVIVLSEINNATMYLKHRN